MGEVPLTKAQEKSTAKWPCDGKPRYSLREHDGALPYSQAYDAILGPSRVFTPDSLRRIKALNRLYLIHARDFVECSLIRAKQ